MKIVMVKFLFAIALVGAIAIVGGATGVSVYRLFFKANVIDTPKCTPKDCCKKLGAANDARPLVDESCRAMHAGLRYIDEGLPQDREMRADARKKLATAIVHAEVWLEATK